MESLYALLRRYPNRIKYGLILVDLFAMIIAIRTYVNYISIETAIEDANSQQQQKTDELAFTENFLVNYEKSEYAKYFLQHENNMLMRNEYIIKFEDMYQKKQVTTGSNNSYRDDTDNFITTPQQSWKKFILDKINKD